MNVVVFGALPPDQLARLQAQHQVTVTNPKSDPAAFAAALPQAEGLIGASYPITPALLDQAPRLRVVSSVSVGVDNYPLAALAQRGIVLCHTPGVLDETVADTVFGLLMATSRRMVELANLVREGRWTKSVGEDLYGWDVHHKTVGLLGFGRIGQAIARRGRFGFGMNVIYHNRSRLAADTEAELGARYMPKDELLRQADHLVLVLPYSAESHHCIAAGELALMKPTATLVNVARGGIVDEDALAAALRERRIAAAGLDVFEGEPRVNPALLTLPNVVLTPHIASATLPTRVAMARLAADNLVAALTSRPPPTPLNPQVLSA